jgi:hypothetical protein
VKLTVGKQWPPKLTFFIAYVAKKRSSNTFKKIYFWFKL